MLVSLAVKVNMRLDDPPGTPTTSKSKKKENRKAIRQLFSPSALIFFAMIFQGGLMWGVKDTYFFVYLQDTLLASSEFLGFYNTIVSVAAVIIMPFAKWIIESVGHIHVCYICMILDAAKLVITTVIRSVTL